MYTKDFHKIIFNQSISDCSKQGYFRIHHTNHQEILHDEKPSKPVLTIDKYCWLFIGSIFGDAQEVPRVYASIRIDYFGRLDTVPPIVSI